MGDGRCSKDKTGAYEQGGGGIADERRAREMTDEQGGEGIAEVRRAREMKSNWSRRLKS